MAPRASKLLELNPVIQQNLLKVGGSLKHANIPHNSKHHIIFPPNDWVTEIIIEKIHWTIRPKPQWMAELSKKSSDLPTTLYALLQYKKTRSKSNLMKRYQALLTHLTTRPISPSRVSGWHEYRIVHVSIERFCIKMWKT